VAASLRFLGPDPQLGQVLIPVSDSCCAAHLHCVAHDLLCTTPGGTTRSCRWSLGCAHLWVCADATRAALAPVSVGLKAASSWLCRYMSDVQDVAWSVPLALSSVAALRLACCPHRSATVWLSRADRWGLGEKQGVRACCAVAAWGAAIYVGANALRGQPHQALHGMAVAGVACWVADSSVPVSRAKGQ
jgi:hypothetical protein